MRKTPILVLFDAYCLDISSYSVVRLQIIGMRYYESATVLQVPIYTRLCLSICLQRYLVGKRFKARSTKKLLSLMCKTILPFCFTLISGILFSDVLCAEYLKQTNEGKLAINSVCASFEYPLYPFTN